MPHYQLILADDKGRRTAEVDTESFYMLGQRIEYDGASWKVAGLTYAGEPTYVSGLICQPYGLAA